MQKKKVIKKEQNTKQTYKRTPIIKMDMKVKNHKHEVVDSVTENEEKPQQKNKRNKKNINNNINTEDMSDNNTLENVKNILNGAELPERPVKIEKKEKGLYERTGDSTILITEDNKVMLTD